MVAYVFAILSLPYMAWTSRMSGGAPPKLGLGLDQWIHTLPLAVLSFFLLTPLFDGNTSYAAQVSIVVLVFSMLGKRLGHGNYMDLATWTLKVEREKSDYILDIFIGVDPNVERAGPGSYKRDLIGLMFTGLMVTLPTTVVLLFSSMWIEAAVMAAAGMAKGLAYVIGTKVQLKNVPHLKEPTEIGELLTGLFVGLGLAYVILNL